MASQMTWQPNLLNQKRKSGPPVGLRNLGNTCYLNSVLQCLTYTPPLANFCLKKQHSTLCDSAAERERKSDCPFCILEKRIWRSLSSDLLLDAPARISNCLKIFAEHFRFGRQEDAHEFLRYVIDACHNTCLRLKKLQQQRRKVINGGGGGGVEGSSGSSVVKEIFGGALQSQVKCLSCNAESNKVDEIMDISLDILNAASLKDALDKFFQPEVLDGSNKYSCDTCKILVAARKQLSILQAPNVLVIQLKRFEGLYGGKIDRAIAFNDILMLSSYMCKENNDSYPEYDLFATIVHSGFSQESGHYYAYIKDAIGRWYCCNDSCVSISNLQEVLSEKAYILFFSRTKQRPVPAKTSTVINGTKTNPVKSVSLTPPSPRVDKIAINPKKVKLGSFGVPKKPPANGSIKKVVHRNGFGETNGDVKLSNGHITGACKTKPIDTVDSEKTQLYVNGNGRSGVVNVKSLEDNGSRDMMPSEMNSKFKKNGNFKSAGNFDLKSKIREDDSCILFAEDVQSRAKVDKLKENLRKEALLVLQSCGWSDKVYDFMRAKKQLCLREAEKRASNIKSLLVAEAKHTFISRVPESLKSSLIKHIQEFSQEKKLHGPT